MYNFELPNKTPTEKKVVTFDFTGEAVEGAVLSAPVVTKALIDGDDTGAALLVVGSPIVQGVKVLALVEAGDGDNVYGLACSAPADNGEVHELAARMRVTDDAA